MNLLNALFWIVIGITNVLRFVGLELSPPGFFDDEAAGAAHVMCIQQTGTDFFGRAFPFFSRAQGGGYSTAPFLYGEALFTGIFGHSVGAFRGFLAFITTATIVLLYDWTRKRVTKRAALFVAFFASISPWAFQFSRVAWDPPLGPFFIMLGLWCFDQKKSFAWIAGALAFAGACFAYPPSRIQAMLLLVFLPAFPVRDKLKVFGVFLFANLPIVYQAVIDPAFTARSKMLAITSDYSQNPYRESSFLGLAFGFTVQFFAHFTPDFLLIHGDRNLRHSTGVVGELSVPEGMVLISGWGAWIFKYLKTGIQKRKRFIDPLVGFAMLGIASGVVPAALTWESLPHALRAIGAWPFYALLSGLTFDFLLQSFELKFPKRAVVFQSAILLASAAFSAIYLSDYFFAYPERAKDWFQEAQNPLGSAYEKMTKLNVSCADIQSTPVHP